MTTIASETTPASAPLPVWNGARVSLQRFPAGTQVCTAPSPSEPLLGPRRAITEALSHPEGADSLEILLQHASSVAVVFSDKGTTPSRCDPRRVLIEQVLELIAAAEIDDVRLVVARGLRARPTESELRTIVGDRVLDSFVPHNLLEVHDASSDTLVPLPAKATPPSGFSGDIFLNASVATADLVVAIDVNDPTYAAIGDLVDALSIHEATRCQTDLAPCVAEALPLLTLRAVAIDHTLGSLTAPVMGAVDATLNADLSTRAAKDLVVSQFLRATLPVLPPGLVRTLNTYQTRSASILEVFAGSFAATQHEMRRAFATYYGVTAHRQSDIVSSGITPDLAHPHTGGLNPLFALHSGLQSVTQTPPDAMPLLRKGGIAVLFAHLAREFDPSQHGASGDFVAEVLPLTHDTETIAAEYATYYAEHPWYKRLYQRGHGYHGLFPLVTWYEIQQMSLGLLGVVAVGADHDLAQTLGVRSATGLADGIEFYRHESGQSTPVLSHVVTPPRVTTECLA